MSACCGSGIPPHVVRSKLQEGQSTKTLQSLRLGPPIRPSLRPCVDTFHPSLIPGARAGYAGQVSQQEDQQASLPLLPPTWGHIIHASPRTRRHQPNLPRAETLGVGGRNELDMYIVCEQPYYFDAQIACLGKSVHEAAVVTSTMRRRTFDPELIQNTVSD